MRHRARALLVKALYQWQLAGHGFDELIGQYSTLAEFGRVDQDYFREVLRLVLDEAAALDRVIAAHAVRKLDQLDAVGRAVLLIALAELKDRPDVPTKVAINEAVELAKKYGATASFKFVNAVLDKASKDLRGQGDRRAC
ncbi:MAG TPA: transcription antitermination factor NusB [Gammaproteobacteria bacterium]